MPGIYGLRQVGFGRSGAGIYSPSSSNSAPNISYPGPYSWIINSTVSGVTPSSYGGPITSYAVFAGSLPTGISLNASTGELSGTPTVLQAATSVTIRATGPYGTSDAVVSIAVTLASLFTPTGYWANEY